MEEAVSSMKLKRDKIATLISNRNEKIKTERQRLEGEIKNAIVNKKIYLNETEAL